MVLYLVSAGASGEADDEQVLVVSLGRREVGGEVLVLHEGERVAVRALGEEGEQRVEEAAEGGRDREEEGAVMHPGDHAARRDLEALLDPLEVVDEGRGHRGEEPWGNHGALEVVDDLQKDVGLGRVLRKKGRVGEVVDRVVVLVVHVVHISCIEEWSAHGRGEKAMSKATLRIRMWVLGNWHTRQYRSSGKALGSRTRGCGIETRERFLRLGRQSGAVRQHAPARQHQQQWRWR